MKVKRILVSIMSLLIVVVMVNPIEAASYNKFTINAVQPENQIDKSVGYFDLRVDSETKQTLEVEVFNNGNEPMEAKMLLVNGSTGNNATKQFNIQTDIDESMQHPITDFVSLREETMVVKPKSKETVHLDVDLKDASFDGVIMGGITVVANEVNMNDKKGNDGEIALDNQIAYTLAVQMRMSDIEIDSNLNYLKTDYTVVDMQPKFTSNIQNDQAVLLNNISIKGDVRYKDSNKVVGTVNRDNGGILPNTNFDVVYDLSEDSVESGVYVVDLKITDGKDTWHWQETIDVTNEQIDSATNEKIDFKDKSKSKFYIIILGILILIILILLFIILKRRKKDEDESTDK
ncbi:MAG: DUF3324 domain-containing protein [Erysipelothrix sp.]